jgi:hypothetical protein
MTARRYPNKFPCKCVHCGQTIPAGQGVRIRNSNGSWRSEHEPSCTAHTSEPVGDVVLSTMTVGDITLTLTGDPNYRPRRAREEA